MSHRYGGTMQALIKHRYTTLTNWLKQTNLGTDLSKTLLINLLDWTLVQPEAALHTYLDNSTEKTSIV